MKRYRAFILALLLSFPVLSRAQENVSLAGEWRFRLDKDDKGLTENWQNLHFSDKIKLPGTTDEAGYGEKTVGSDYGTLTRAFKYIGPAWYQCDITVPESWKDKRIFLELERVIWESRVFVDEKEVSMQDALNSVHRHDLGFLSPGKHRLTVRISNEMIYDIGDYGHLYTEATQSIWNGAVGRIRLVARDKMRFGNPKVFTDISPASFRVTDTMINESKKKTVNIRYELYTADEENRLIFTKTEKRILENGKNALAFSSGALSGIKLWDDVRPNLYRLKLSVEEKEKAVDVSEFEIGFRKIEASRSKISVNGRSVFLRGNIDNVHFPLTGYPSCNIADWERIFRIYKSYGLNHVRFHSWCPPEAAFAAADRVGIYIQAESIWITYPFVRPTNPPDGKVHEPLGKNPSADAFVQAELRRMVETYGNHASFIMMCIGNELGSSDFDVMESWMKSYRTSDSRRLYSVSTARKIVPSDQYIVTHRIDEIGGAVRGIRGGASTDWDFDDIYSRSQIPVIAHEIGQWPIYPRWDEIKKYKGVLKARNLEEFREQARRNKIDRQDDEFADASGALNQMMYKYEIESFLRTPSCAGLQLLSMQDYSGQGEALVGWLDSFYDSKGITTPEKFRRHCDTTVALLRMSKYVWENNETFRADIQLAHYGARDLSTGLYWTISDEESNLIGKGEIPQTTYKTGTSALASGTVSCDLSQISKASKLTVEVGLSDDAVKNTWNIWIYPVKTPIHENKNQKNNVFLTDRFDEECIRQLSAGGKVLLSASALGNDKTCDRINFYPLYWSLTFFPGQGVNTIGLLVRDKHPAFALFPTADCNDWQWQPIYRGARAFYINDYSESYKPIAQPIDDFHRNNKLASIFELKVGKGKLLVCGFDLSNPTNPVARQLKASLLHYMLSDDFDPEYEKDIASLRETFVYEAPLKSNAPEEFKDALLYIECGAGEQISEKNVPWSSASDVFEAKDGTGYRVVCEGVRKDDSGSAWHGRKAEIEIDCPHGFIGSFYVYFRSANRKATVNFEGREYILEKPDKGGLWIKLHVMREDSNDGKLLFKIVADDDPTAPDDPDLAIGNIAVVKE